VHAPTTAVRAEDIERWLGDLGLEPLQRAEREGITAWDIDLDGRRRFDLRTTLILDPALGLICWAHLAPPIGDGLRKAYRLLLQWNDEFPFAKFSLAADGRPVLAVELPGRFLDQKELGLALARDRRHCGPPPGADGGLALDRRADPQWLRRAHATERRAPRHVRAQPSGVVRGVRPA
jgi:hypothetical protein